jgi:hypothetical protein
MSSMPVYNIPADEIYVVRETPDVITLALGYIPTCPSLPKMESQTAGTARDILSNEKGRGRKVIIVGGS